MTDPNDDLAHEDDTIIGRAFRISLIVIGALALVGVGVYFLLRAGEDSGPEVEIETVAPEAVPKASGGGPLTAPFTDVTSEAGIRFEHFNGAYGDKLLPESMGSGAAFFDADADGDPDLLLVNGTAWPHRSPPSPLPTQALYTNDGSGRFRDSTREAGLALSFYGTGVAVGDVDNDGLEDLFLAAVGPNRLLANRGGRFEDVTARAGVAGGSETWSTSAGFFDYDDDGDLDLFVCNYVEWSKEIDFRVDYRLDGVGRAYGPPVNYAGTHSALYRNEGDLTFTDVSASAGIQVVNPATGAPAGKALGLAPIDADGNGWMDLLVANDTVGNFFFLNRGDGTFSEEGILFGLAYGRNGEATGAMGIDSGHFRNDAELGFLIGNFANEMTSVYVSQGDPTLFADEAIPEGIGAPTRTHLSFGLFLFDDDLDGRLDLLQANGHLEEQIASVDPSQAYRQPAQLFRNTGPSSRQGFQPVPPEASGDLARPLVGRGATYADIDGDGDLDVLLTQVAGPPLLLRNDQATGHHWLRVKLEGDPARQVNRDAIGAWVELSSGGTTQRRQVMPTRSYQSQVELPVTFGLGEAAKVDSLKILWPDGSEQTVESPEANRVLTVRQGT